ncbi:RNA-guided endonuclease InsQ/TnpB family protein [Marinobacter flavimaris]|uniref:RNA-guided endonuclease InsQ/TnpB family protein n=1 Tax=Marinobacter flavimaris TaxID=262076 RepID=UPI0038639389
MDVAFKTQLLPNNKQRTYFAKASGISRFTWNWALAEWDRQYTMHKNGNGDRPSGMALKRQFNALKKSEFPWVYEVTKYASQQPFIALQRAFSDWMKDLKSSKPQHLKKRRPRFKKKGKATDTFYVGGDQVKVDGRRVKLPNQGWVRLAEPIKYGGHINNMTISRQADKWFVSFSMKVEVCSLPSKSQARCGVDLGIKSLATISQGDIREWKSPKPLQEALRKLARYQRRLMKKVKGSAGYRKLKTRIARLHKRIADIRANTLHQLSCYLSTHFSEVVIEDLNVRGMMANGKLARHIADVGLYEFRRQMTYKMDWRGGVLTVADRWYPSSKLCSGCGSRKPDLTLADRTYHCEACGHKECRDFNASKNLEKFSTARSAGIYAAGDDGSALAA